MTIRAKQALFTSAAPLDQPIYNHPSTTTPLHHPCPDRDTPITQQQQTLVILVLLYPTLLLLLRHQQVILGPEQACAFQLELTDALLKCEPCSLVLLCCFQEQSHGLEV